MRPTHAPVLVPNEDVLTPQAATMLREVYVALPELTPGGDRMLVIRPAPTGTSWIGIVPTGRAGRYRLVELRDRGLVVREDAVLERRIVEVLGREYRDYTVAVTVGMVDRARVAARFDAPAVAPSSGEGPDERRGRRAEPVRGGEP